MIGRFVDPRWWRAKGGVAERLLFTLVALTFFCLPLGTAPSSIAAGLAAAVWLFSGIALKKRRHYLSTWWWPVYLMMLLPLLGLLYTHDDTGIAADYAGKAYYWLFGMVVAGISFEFFSAKRLIQAFLLGLGVNVLAASAQMVLHLEDEHNWHLGLGPDYSTLSAFLIVGILMGFYFLRRQTETRDRLALLGLIGLYFFHLVVLRSRASYVAIVMLVPFIGYTFFRTQKALKTMAVCLLVPGLMLLSPVVRERLALSVEQLSHHLVADDDAAWGRSYSAQQDRFYMWHGALKLIGEHPWIGVGTGGYMSAMKANDPDPDVPTIAHPHNNFLHMGVSYGVAGIGVFVWLLVQTLISGWRHRQTAPGYMLLSVVLVMVATGLFNTQILDVGTAILLALVIGLQPNRRARTTPPPVVS